MNYWLMKSEPETYSLEHLKAKKDSTDHWEGVRNYQARNLLRDQIKKGDKVLFYHSSCSVPGVAGIAEVVREGYPDFSALDSASNYYDPKSSAENPRWFMVDIRWEEAFKRLVSLKELREIPELEGMKLLQKGQRLSVQPVTESEYHVICRMGRNQ